MQLYPTAVKQLAKKIFKSGSITYYYSSLFFPRDAREDISTLYAFVRTADDFVDAVPQQVRDFEEYCKQTHLIYNNKTDGAYKHSPIIKAFCEMAKRNDIPYSYVDAFFKAMRADTSKKTYNTFAELEEYMYGSAEVIGLMMCKILNLPEESYTAAKLQGKAMQLINFIRDINEDISLGRQYIPTEDMKKFKMKTLEPKTESDKENFRKLVQFELERYRSIQNEAQKGYTYIPKQYLVPIKTAASMYNWTALQIEQNPLAVFKGKIKPTPIQVIRQTVVNYFYP